MQFSGDYFRYTVIMQLCFINCHLSTCTFEMKGQIIDNTHNVSDMKLMTVIQCICLLMLNQKTDSLISCYQTIHFNIRQLTDYGVLAVVIVIHHHVV